MSKNRMCTGEYLENAGFCRSEYKNATFHAFNAFHNFSDYAYMHIYQIMHFVWLPKAFYGYFAFLTKNWP